MWPWSHAGRAAASPGLGPHAAPVWGPRGQCGMAVGSGRVAVHRHAAELLLNFALALILHCGASRWREEVRQRLRPHAGLRKQDRKQAAVRGSVR